MTAFSRVLRRRELFSFTPRSRSLISCLFLKIASGFERGLVARGTLSASIAQWGYFFMEVRKGSPLSPDLPAIVEVLFRLRRGPLTVREALERRGYSSSAYEALGLFDVSLTDSVDS
jgi:hypothetical protein